MTWYTVSLSGDATLGLRNMCVWYVVVGPLKCHPPVLAEATREVDWWDGLGPS